ncbi:MAG TPA: hybrid sensor histidine kinase/response regulator [Candidatus Thermoplasmatota archaeon]
MATDARTKVLLVSARDPKSLRETAQRGVGGDFSVEAVPSVEDALSRLSRGDIGLVLFDLEDGDSGHWNQFTRIEAQAPDVPVVVVTAKDDDQVSARALRDGAQDHITKDVFGASQFARTVRFAIERHRIVRERQAALERLRELERFKTQFINTAAHELNSPLTPVKLQLHLLRTEHAEGLSQKQKGSLDIMERNVDRLIALVSDVLEAARLQANRLVVKKEPVDLHQIVSEAVESMQPQAHKVGVDLVLDSKAGFRAEADPDRIAQVVYNLIGNALKFTPRGGKVKVATAKEGEFAIVRVTDTGIGLRPEDFLRLFQPFSQTHEWTTSKRPGSGLGLYISQGIVEQHGGRIWCDSPGPNRGSTFSFAIPLPKPASAPKASAKTAPHQLPTHGFWKIVYFKCPTCSSRDINMRILRNKYECRACEYQWQ